METEMELTLEDLASEEAWARDYKWETDGAFSDMLILPRKTYLNVIAAARAHLENERMIAEYDAENRAEEEAIYSAEELAEIRAPDPQPPQQREDDGFRHDSTDCTDLAGNVDDRGSGVSAMGDASVAPAPSSTVCAEPYNSDLYAAANNPSPDAGLVERLNRFADGGPNPNLHVCREAAAALEAKDAEIAELSDMNDKLVDDAVVRDVEIARRDEEYGIVCSERDKAQAEIERLREALEKIADYRYEPAAEIARAALKGGA
jgi:hypothetical protein